MFRAWLLVLALSQGLIAATVQTALQVPTGAEDKLDAQAAFVARLLEKGGAVYFRLPDDALPSRDAKGQWRPEPLQAALRAQGPLAFRGDQDQAAKGLDISTEPLQGEDEGRWLLASGLPKITLVEDSSTVSPMSKGLAAWKWPFTIKSFAEVEADPQAVLAAGAQDMVVFSSPGWWEDFANPPGGPSRMPKKVSEALRDFVRQGGSALFIDVAQWDLERAWPKTLNLAPLGPYQVNKLRLEGGPSGGVSLAPVGVATDKLRSAGAFALLGDDHFSFPDGGSRPVFAAYAMPDPGGGQGWVGGLAFHVFEQDDALAGRLRRLLLNLLLLSGDRRLSTQGEPKVPTPPPASPTRTPRRSPTASPTASDLPTLGPSPTPSPTQRPTLEPTAAPTRVPTAPPTALPTPVPKPTIAPTPWRVPTALMALPTPKPTRVPALARSATPLALPPPPLPTVAPTLAPPPPLPTRSAARLKPPALPTRAPSPHPTAVATPGPKHRPGAAPTALVIPLTETVQAAADPRPTVVLSGSVKNSLGCLESAPEPFSDGGVYLKFCLARACKAQVRVYDAQGRPLWKSAFAAFEAGNHQVHYDGRANGRDISPGRYLWEVHVLHADGHAEERQSGMSRRRARQP